MRRGFQLAAVALLASRLSAEQVRIDHWTHEALLMHESITSFGSTNNTLSVGEFVRGVSTWDVRSFGNAKSADLVLWSLADTEPPPLNVHGVYMASRGAASINSSGLITQPEEFRPDLYEALDDGPLLVKSEESISIMRGRVFHFDADDLAWLRHIAMLTPGLISVALVPEPGYPDASLDVTLILDPEHIAGDANADGLLTNLDIAAFAAGLTHSDAGGLYEVFLALPVYWEDLDIDGNGLVNNIDIAPFVAMFIGEAAVVPEPPAIVSALLGIVPLCFTYILTRLRFLTQATRWIATQRTKEPAESPAGSPQLSSRGRETATRARCSGDWPCPSSPLSESLHAGVV